MRYRPKLNFPSSPGAYYSVRWFREQCIFDPAKVHACSPNWVPDVMESMVEGGFAVKVDQGSRRQAILSYRAGETFPMA